MGNDMIDASDAKEDWDAGIASGKLKIVRRGQTDGRHVQGEPLDNLGEKKRVISAATMNELIETRRLPSAKKGRTSVTAPRGGWPVFGTDGKIEKKKGQ